MVYRRSRSLTFQRWRHFDPLPLTADGRQRVVRQLLVLETLAVQGPPGTGISHWELWFAPDDEPDARVLVVLTRDEADYQKALDAEGTPQRFDLTFHLSQRPDGSICRRLDTLVRT